ncbi:hypothetical protein, partial [Akkermansia sp.]|uniref:hypothetical protein n=1 Tax=Akkermansia sp. TaxID=1872421 RepID=UPI003AF983D2
EQYEENIDQPADIKGTEFLIKSRDGHSFLWKPVGNGFGICHGSFESSRSGCAADALPQRA